MTAAPLRIRALDRPAGGSSLPWFCALDDDTTRLVKFSGAGPGPGALAAEQVAAGLARYWNLPVPEAVPVRLDSSVPRAGTDEFWDVLAASQGWNLAIKLIPDGHNITPDPSLPVPALANLTTFDTVLINWDRTVLSCNLLRDGDGKVWWIDHGSCRFLHQLESRRRPALAANHFLFNGHETRRAQPLPIPPQDAIDELIGSVPKSWLAAIPGEPSSLSKRLHQYLSYVLTE